MAKEATALKQDATPVKQQPLNQTRIQEADFLRTRWFASVPKGTTRADLEDPAYWRNVGQRFKPMDMIEIVTEDGEWYARLIVINAARLWAKVHILDFADLRASQQDMPLTDDQNHIVEWKGPGSKWAVIRKEDSAMLKDGFTSQMEALQWLEGHIKSLLA